jgi:hypothetical protein
MEKFSVYEFKGVPHQSWNGERRVEKMTLKKCINEVFYVPGNGRWFEGQRDMKQFWDCNYHYNIIKRSLEDIRDSVENGYLFIPFSKNVDKDDVLAYINAGLKPLFMRAKEYITMKKAYEKIA